ncbi:MAG: hypothetical protein JZU50_02625 [Desulfobulbaceae bacterium]|nr:hypothetical protein [Desulfobulbaceae bacterium]
MLNLAYAETPKSPDLQTAIAAIGPTPESLFVHVRDRIKPSLNRLALQSPTQVLVSGYGNTLERARLLAALLTAAGHPIRFQTCLLDDEKAGVLIQAAMSSAGKVRNWPAEVPLSRPAADRGLIEGVRLHTWVQVLSGERWLNLDPAFPGATPGMRPAAATATFYRFSEARLPRLELTLEYNRVATPAEFEELIWWEGPLEAVADQPLSLRIYPRITVMKAGEQGDLDPARKLVDPLAGGDEKTVSPVTVTTWQATLWLGDQMLISDQLADLAAAENRLCSLRLRARIIFAEDDILEDLRVLAEVNEAGKLPLFQRHSLLFATSAFNPVALQQWLLSHPPAQRAAAHQESERIRYHLTETGTASSSLLDASLGAEQMLGGYSGHLLNLAYCVVSDQMSADLANRLGVYAYFDHPRLIITSVFTEADNRQRIMLDLRRDRQPAVALPGQAQRIVESYQFGRGVMASALEGRLVTLATGTPALTTTVLMRQAQTQGIPVRLYSMWERDLLANLSLPEFVLSRIKKKLQAGQIVMLPVKPVQFAGGRRWGWWQIDPVSHHTVGVLDSGLHQAVIERTLIETEGVLSDEMAAVIGAISGATDTQFALSAMVLKHGDLNAEALAEVKEYMANLGEDLCQQHTVEAKVGGGKTIASASVEIEGCFRYEQSMEIVAEAGGSLTLMDKGWCEAFQRGFSCAAMTLLNAYLDEQK